MNTPGCHALEDLRDDLPRCPWVNLNNPLYVAYHDLEWGVPRDLSDDALFELLTLETFQAGLSWETVLNKREAFRKAFRGFRIERVARMGRSDVARLLKNAGIIRNRAKIESAVANARRVREIRKETGSLRAFLEPYRPTPRPRKRRRTIPDSTEDSERLSEALKERGFRFVGPVIVYSFMQAIGWVNDHADACFLAPEP